MYHDLGNVNYSVHVPRETFSRAWFAGVVARAGNACLDVEVGEVRGGGEVGVNCRHDVVMRDVSGERKLSGSAYKITRLRAYHHGTFLVDAELARLREVLGGKGDGAGRYVTRSRGVVSVRASVTNLFPRVEGGGDGNVSGGGKVAAFVDNVVRLWGLEHGIESSRVWDRAVWIRGEEMVDDSGIITATEGGETTAGMIAQDARSFEDPMWTRAQSPRFTFAVGLTPHSPVVAREWMPDDFPPPSSSSTTATATAVASTTTTCGTQPPVAIATPKPTTYPHPTLTIDTDKAHITAISIVTHPDTPDGSMPQPYERVSSLLSTALVGARFQGSVLARGIRDVQREVEAEVDMGGWEWGWLAGWIEGVVGEWGVANGGKCGASK